MVGRTLYVAPSEIHGRGCFTTDVLRPATRFRIPFYETKYETFTSVLTEGGLYELYSPFRFLNHSSDPNCEVYQLDDGSFELYTLREVAPHEELTIHYGEDWDDPE